LFFVETAPGAPQERIEQGKPTAPDRRKGKCSAFYVKVGIETRAGHQGHDITFGEITV